MDSRHKLPTALIPIENFSINVTSPAGEQYGLSVICFPYWSTISIIKLKKSDERSNRSINEP